MANKNFLGYMYFCSVCEIQYEMKDDLLSEICLEHENGEELNMLIVSCPHCESVAIPEGMNAISWLMPNQEDKKD